MVCVISSKSCDCTSQFQSVVFIFARPCEALLHISMRVISMSAHVSYETPNDVADKIYEMVQANNNGRMKKGSNEVTKAAERGTAKFIIMAEDVNPPELLAHIPLICAEKDIPFGYVPSQEFLAKEAGMPGGVKTASLALLEVSKGAQEKFNEVVELVKGLSS